VRRLGALVAAGLLLGACATEARILPGREVRFPSEDGVELAGDVRGEGDRGVVLAHGFGSDRSAWDRLATELADEGYLALTFDLRGFGGSDGVRDAEAAPQDVLGAVAALRDEGARSIVLVGASAGGSASLVAAAGPEVALEGVVTLSAPGSFLGLEVSSDIAAAVEEPKLFIAGDRDAPARAAAQSLFEAAPPPKRMEIVAGGEHGAALLEGQRASFVRDLILDFLARHS
jgi:pimeloyl-ACP methyl ester carboxylesterase